MSSPIPTPKRQLSTASSVSSGRTIKASGETRRSSVSSNGFFARFRQSSGRDGHENGDEDEDEDGYENENDIESKSDDGDELKDTGESDIRSGIALMNWRKASETVPPEDIESGPFDEWGDGWPSSPRSLQLDSPRYSLDDEREYQNRMRVMLGGDDEEEKNKDFGFNTPPRPRSFIHPSISRLRSNGALGSSPTPPRHYRTASNFSQISETSVASAQASSSGPGFVFHPLRRAQVPEPTCMDVKGLIAVGTKSGTTYVYSFTQELRCILGSKSVPVTSVSISSDSTYVGVGHFNGDIYLYDLSNPTKPARSVLATTLQQVSNGRKEGHIGSAVTQIGFVGARHTSIVTGDEHGRVFWWSLGRIMGVDSNDVLRMLGNYQKNSSLFAALPLPLASHPADGFNLSALLTPAKLLIVGLKPARTWFRKPRDVPHFDYGAAAWLPGEAGSDPVLSYSWGMTLRLLKVKQEPSFLDIGRWDAPSPIRTINWFDKYHLLLQCDELILFNLPTMAPIEYTSIPPTLSIRTYREKVFTLAENVNVASLLHWNERIIARVHQGDFLGAIHLALAYYEGRAQGNTIGLEPENSRSVIAARIKDLMKASLDWAFSEERMRDDTHYSADGRGVDLTTLFESLATSCIEACLATGDTDFLFSNAYEHYSSAGIQTIFLRLLEPYIFEGQLRFVPPEIVKALISLHTDSGEYQEAEAIIWQVEPSNLDINQAITLCEKHELWDALIHVYNRTLKDFVTPLERILHTSKVYSYLELLLSGHSFPVGEPLPEEEAQNARSSIYTFILSHLSAFEDTEALLHSLDIAFEDSYLDDAPIGRQTIVNQLLSSDLDPTLLRLFVARNIPKYPQFIFLSPSVLHDILVGLSKDPDTSTRDDRQLATEYLLSAYVPHDDVYGLFEEAGFYRILRHHYRSEQKWEKLLQILVLEPVDLFTTLSELASQLEDYLEPVLPNLLSISLLETASYLNEHRPEYHQKAIATLSPIRQLNYLRSVLELANPRLDLSLRHKYAHLLVQFDRTKVLRYLDSYGPESFDLSDLWTDFQNFSFIEGEIWTLDKQGHTHSAFETVNEVLRTRGADLISDPHQIDTITSVTQLAITLCQQHADHPDIEPMWYGILHELVELVSGISVSNDHEETLTALRTLITETLSALISAPLSLPRLFKRLVDSSTKNSRVFAELRAILTSMLDSYRAEGDMLVMSTRMIEADLFQLVEEATEKRQRGWTISSFQCGRCGRELGVGDEDFVLRASGQATHVDC